MNKNKVARACSISFLQQIQESFLYFLKTIKVWCLHVINFQKMAAMYCSQNVLNILSSFSSCFYKIDHYKALFLNSFSLAVSLNCSQLQVISAETQMLFYTYFLQLIFRTQYFTDGGIFRIFSISVFLLCRIPFIVIERYNQKINTRLSSQNLNKEK